ncbi:response regulator transcription factor [Patescibacteria group bacterium]
MKKILIAEDDKPMARTMRIKLAKSGFDVTVAVDGEEALEFLSKDKFDLILLDIMMPKVNGFKVLEEMKNRGDNTPVVVTSNLSQSSDKSKVMELGARDYFVKSNTSIFDIVDHVKGILNI